MPSPSTARTLLGVSIGLLAIILAVLLWTQTDRNPAKTLASPPSPTTSIHVLRPQPTTPPTLLEATASLPDITPSSEALEALAQDPVRAVATGRRLFATKPDEAETVGTLLIGALIRASAHSAALELAEAGPETLRAEWMKIIFRSWTESDPSQAPEIADLLRQNGVSGQVLASLAAGWAISAPEQAAGYAVGLPPGEHRTVALSAALNQWIQRNPAAVANWLPQLRGTSEYDEALTTFLTHTDTAVRPVAQALALASEIRDPALQRAALTHVLREWYAADPAAAIRYGETHPAFDANQRRVLIDSFAPKREAP